MEKFVTLSHLRRKKALSDILLHFKREKSVQKQDKSVEWRVCVVGGKGKVWNCV